MTVDDAIAHADQVLATHQLTNASYMANGQLAQHAETATILLDLAQQLLTAQARVVELETMKAVCRSVVA